MKVLLVNGSPHKTGCTYTALQEVSKALQSEGITAHIFWLENKAISGCIACNNCKSEKKCIFDDKVNEFLNLAKDYDGFIFGSPVHFGSATGAITSFLDRSFYTDLKSNRQLFYLKPAASVISARRAGTTSTYDQLNKYFGLMQMPIISSQYWNMVHGSNPEEVKKDLEGMQTMRTLGKNMAFFLKCKRVGLESGIKLPEKEPKVSTNFIR